MRDDLTPDVLDAIAAAGFSVYQPRDPNWRTYCYFTDGKNVGYLQRNRFGPDSLSTVHTPNHKSGTGFQAGEVKGAVPTREELELAFMHAPAWAYREDRESVVKYGSWDAFVKSRRLDDIELVREAVRIPANETFSVGQPVKCPADRGDAAYTGKVTHVGPGVYRNIQGAPYQWITVEKADGKSRHVWPSNRIERAGA